MTGETLKKRREELGGDLKEIAHALKIRYDYLKAIEEDDFKKLPAPVYTKGYIRGYANFLYLDPKPLIKAYDEKISPPSTEKQDFTPEIEKPQKSKIKYFIALAALSIIAASYFFISTLPKKAEMPTQKPTTHEPASAPKPDRTDQDLQAPAEKTIIEKTHTLDISADDTTWILVKTDGIESKEMLLKPGESVKFSASKGFALTIGNAGGISLVFDGKSLGKLGEKGRVVSLNLPPSPNTDTPRN